MWKSERHQADDESQNLLIQQLIGALAFLVRMKSIRANLEYHRSPLSISVK